MGFWGLRSLEREREKEEGKEEEYMGVCTLKEFKRQEKEKAFKVARFLKMQKVVQKKERSFI